MTSFQELKETSLSFRRISSNLLNSTFENGDVQLERFKKYIDDNCFISNIIKKAINDIEYDYKLCFTAGIDDDWGHIRIPVDEKCHIKAMYEYISLIVESDRNLYQFAKKYSNKSKFNEAIEEFVENAFKPLIDYINDCISKEMILVSEDSKPFMQSITQKIENVYGTANMMGTGDATLYNFTNTSTSEINELLLKIMSSFEFIKDIPQAEIENVKDDIESVAEQINAASPKKNRIQKALAGIKKFATDFSMKLAVNWAVGRVTNMDWENLIEKIEQYLVQ